MQRVSFKLEFLFRASPAIVYKFLSTPGCLIRWFCDEVDIQGTQFTYSWDGSEEVANVIEDIEAELLRFRWDHAETDEEYLEYALQKSPVTGETILEITDFCDEDEVEEQKQLWETQIQQLKRAMGV